jgi:hypothetical protein
MSNTAVIDLNGVQSQENKNFNAWSAAVFVDVPGGGMKTPWKQQGSRIDTHR